MRIPNRKPFALGLAMALSFMLVFLLMFTPNFGGTNAFRAADGFFNSVSKGSADYFPRLRAEIAGNRGDGGTADPPAGEAPPEIPIDVFLDIPPGSRERAASLLAAGGVDVRTTGERLAARGDLTGMLLAALDDAESLFHNREAEIAARRGWSGEETLLVWERIFLSAEFELKRQKRSSEADLVESVRTKAIEVAYNYRGIEPIRVRDRAALVVFLLVSYIGYTVWWGFALLFLATGFGLQLKAGHKKEV